ncbi:unnamed protein product [Anisakis simplex]|uniref:Olfactory channel (inferred by orthology to a C. elegans protein) n=1 Tax=Anisakis simplex TaxID=6269 RepID=A0A0M3K0Y2_ANISI|nr:unnamed protein product [Anisakis simplex]
MGQLKSKLIRSENSNLKADPDEKWSNLYREREKNHLYKWVGVRTGGDLISAFEKDGEDGVLRFANDKFISMMYDDGAQPQLIKFADYAKWKMTVNVQLGKADDKAESSPLESMFREHLAQWKLNKRGVEGETIVHLLLNREEPMCCEIARILIAHYPGLANDIYLGDEMFGQSALHLAIVHDDYETVQLLLQSGADVNARACGAFFLPEDITDYRGYAYYGEYPLAFAACFGNKDIYDLLIQYGADPDLKDMYGNTILHMCVINYSNSMYSYAVRHWEKPADPNIVNFAGLTPLTLATKLGRKDIFEEMLELMKVLILTAVDYDSALMTVINGSTAEHLDMIGSEVIQRLLADKWKAFASRKLFERLGLLALHLVFLCFVVYLRPTEPERLTYQHAYTSWDDWVCLS